MESNNLFPAQKNTSDGSRFLRVLWSWAWLVVIIAVVMGGIAFMLFRDRVPVYTATALLSVNGYTATGSSTNESVQAGERLAISYSHILDSSEIVGKALSLVGGGLSYNELKSGITVAPVRDTQLVQINVAYKDPVLAAKIANSILDVFDERLKSDYATNTLATRQNLQVRIDALGKEITSLQDQIYLEYKKNQDGRIASVTNSMIKIEEEISQLSSEVARLDHIENVITKDLYGRKIIETATPNVEDQKVIAMKQAQIDERKDILRSYQYEYVTLTTQGDQTFGSDPTISRLQSYLTQLQGTYVVLKQNLDSIEPSNMDRTPSMIQVYRADVPKEPAQSKARIYAALGFLLGLLVTTVGIYAIDVLDPHIKDPELIPQKFGLPVLAAMYKSKMSGKTLAEQIKSNPQVYDTSRLLRMKVAEKEDNDIVLFTGLNPVDNSDSLAANLAEVMAESGTSTLLIDMNMYQSVIPGLFNMGNPKGLGDFLSGSMNSIDEVIKATPVQCLSVICAGGLTPAQINQFNTQKGKDLIRKLKERYEFIIINAPSVLSSADAVLLTPLVKSVILVLNPAKSTIGDLKLCIKNLSSVNAKIMGVVLSNMSLRWYQFFYGRPSSSKMSGI